MITALFLITTAMASTSYPGGVYTEASMPCLPQCTLCHTDNLGGAGTVTSEFGLAMMERGLEGSSQGDLLIAAMVAMEADAVDSDSDGTLDVDELANGDEPNGGVAFCSLPSPSYGCFNHVSGSGFSGGAAVLALLALRRRRGPV